MHPPRVVHMANHGQNWSNFCSKNGVDPWTASDMDICQFVVARSEETASPNVVEADLKAVMSFRKNAGKPIGNAPFASLVVKGLGVFPQDYSTHSFRKGGLSVLGADFTVSPAFVQKSARHKHWASTV